MAITPAPLFVLQESVDLGEIMYSLCYLPTAGRMTLTVIKCRNLKAMDITGSSGNHLAFCSQLTAGGRFERNSQIKTLKTPSPVGEKATVFGSSVQTCTDKTVTAPMPPRPLCEGLHGVRWTEVEEAKDNHQEKHAQPHVQRGHHL